MGAGVLDTTSLRVAFTVVALTLLVLFYFVNYRSTRSAYCGWWCIALVMFLSGSAFFLFDGTSHQVWGNPLGNTLLVLGAGSVWAGARAIRRRPNPWWGMLGAALITVMASALDTPSTNVWSGGPFYLSLMTLLIGLASANLWAAASDADSTHVATIRSMALASGALALFYALRTIAFIAVGQDGALFTEYLDSDVATIINTVLLATASFSMTALSHAEETNELRARATHDGLTGLLNRTEFVRLAAARVQSGRRGPTGTLILADLDHFKSVNDAFGHPAGDYALQTFAAACRGVVRSTDLVGRFGGEEFVLFLDDTPVERAQQVATDISARLKATPTPDGLVLPTVSYGIAHAAHGDQVDDVIAVADRALYEAKNQGRDRTVVARA